MGEPGTGGRAAAHLPVMRDRIVDLLSPALTAPSPSGTAPVYVDCTLGAAGHAEAILASAPEAILIGIDRDASALELAGARLATFGSRVRLFHAAYDRLAEVLAEAGVVGVDAILMDLGLSSMQIDQRERGFAYAVDAPLDMRMDATQELTAATVVNTYSVGELARVLRVYGEERFADRIARRIVAVRQQAPFSSSAALVRAITDALPAAARTAGGGHPAKRTFQALRIEVNAELESLRQALPQALTALAPGGRLAVLAYHSGEDRLVKSAFREAASDRVPPGLPMVPDALKARFHLLTRGAERPAPAETAANPRAASARLRAVVRDQEVSR